MLHNGMILFSMKENKQTKRQQKEHHSDDLLNTLPNQQNLERSWGEVQ